MNKERSIVLETGQVKNNNIIENLRLTRYLLPIDKKKALKILEENLNYKIYIDKDTFIKDGFAPLYNASDSFH